MSVRGVTRDKVKLVRGVGVNDLDFPVLREAYTDEEGVYHPAYNDPIYALWVNMLTRTNSPKYLVKFPAYKVVSVSEDWLLASNFYSWVQTKDYVGKVLDKDIIGDGTIYSAETCCFVSPRLNGFLIGSKLKKDLPLGVTWEADRQKYKAEIALGGKSKRLGNFKDKNEAHLVYCKKKLEIAQILVDDERVESFVKEALLTKLQNKVLEAELIYQQNKFKEK